MDLNMTAKNNRRSRVLIVSLPGMMQNVLRETFTNRADVDVVGFASGGLSAVSLIRQEQPDLVVIDSSLPEAETSKLILWIKSDSQHTRSLVLVENTQQLNKATSAGADVALRSYSLLDSLDNVLESMSTNQRTNTE